MKKLYVHEAVQDAFTEALLSRVATVRHGDPAQSDTVMGPVIDLAAAEQVMERVAASVTMGARVLAGGTCDGTLVAPTVLDRVVLDAPVIATETFGPVLGICPVDDPWQGLRFANDNRYGLAGFVFTRDLARGLTLCEGMEAGSVWLNDIQRSSHYEPFGGVKESGLGREKGRYGVESYLEYKTMYLSYEVPR